MGDMRNKESIMVNINSAKFHQIMHILKRYIRLKPHFEEDICMEVGEIVDRS